MAIVEISVMPGSVIYGAKGVEEIVQNVRTILTTRKGTVPLDRDFGLDFTFLDAPINVSKARLQNEVFEAIRKYEPRAVIREISFNTEQINAMSGRMLPTVKIEINPGVIL